MKVKVAEALSYGLVVIGTEHAFIGYKVDGVSCVLAETEKEFIDAIFDKNNYDKKFIVKSVFEDLYAIKHSKNMFHKAIDSVLKEQ
jgi:hypothetical protein